MHLSEVVFIVFQQSAVKREGGGATLEHRNVKKPSRTVTVDNSCRDPYPSRPGSPWCTPLSCRDLTTRHPPPRASPASSTGVVTEFTFNGQVPCAASLAAAPSVCVIRSAAAVRGNEGAVSAGSASRSRVPPDCPPPLPPSTPVRSVCDVIACAVTAVTDCAAVALTCITCGLCCPVAATGAAVEGVAAGVAVGAGNTIASGLEGVGHSASRAAG